MKTDSAGLLDQRGASLRFCYRFAGLLAILLAAGQAFSAANFNAQSPRLTVAVMNFENQTGDAEAASWRYEIASLLRGQLEEVKSLRVLRTSAPYPTLNLTRNDPVNQEQARRIGELVEARRVIWGNYRRAGQKWVVTVNVLNVGSGRASPNLEAASEDWYEVRDNLTRQILAELGIKPAKAELVKLLLRSTSSSSALEWFGKSHAASEELKPAQQVESCLRNALAADPQFPDALAGLGAILGTQGQFGPAEDAIHQALKLRPDKGDFHGILAYVLIFKGDIAGAEKELREALRLEPEVPDRLVRLGECCMSQDRVDEAIRHWKDAERLAPSSAGIHAHLGHAYAVKGQRQPALIELAEADRLGPDANALQFIWQGYDALHEIPLAVQHLDKFVSFARKLGVQPEMVASVEMHGRVLKASLKPHEIAAAMPTVYTPESLQAALRERLTDHELTMVVNPLAGTPEMDRWARELTAGAADDLEKARRLFDALVRRSQSGEGGARTAREVFASWKDPAQGFSCQEYAKLYVALARAVGIKAFYVHLEKDYLGDFVYHDCAAVFSNGKAYLVDLAYSWFGAAHHDYLVLDDLQTIAHQCFQFSETDEGVVYCLLATKLHPDFAWGQMQLAVAYLGRHKVESARQALAAALRLEPNRWDGPCIEGAIAAAVGNKDAAVQHFHKALEINPKFDHTHMMLGQVLQQQGKLKEAQDEFRLAFLCSSSTSLREAASRLIAEINEQMLGR